VPALSPRPGTPLQPRTPEAGRAGISLFCCRYEHFQSLAMRSLPLNCLKNLILLLAGLADLERKTKKRVLPIIFG
jgi:hypothetical protein